MLYGGRVIVDAASVAARVRHHDIRDAEGAGKVVVLPDRDACCASGAAAGDAQRQSVLKPGKVQRQISGRHDALHTRPIVDVQVLGEGERRDFGRHCTQRGQVTR